MKKTRTMLCLIAITCSLTAGTSTQTDTRDDITKNANKDGESVFTNSASKQTKNFTLYSETPPVADVVIQTRYRTVYRDKIVTKCR